MRRVCRVTLTVNVEGIISWGRDVKEAGDGNCVIKRWKRQGIVVGVGEGGECASGMGKQLLSILEMY